MLLHDAKKWIDRRSIKALEVTAGVVNATTVEINTTAPAATELQTASDVAANVVVDSSTTIASY
jgi:hypothetical protein